MSKSRDIADSAATINYIDGLTSDAQGQLNDKATLDGSPTFTGTVTATAFSGDGSGLTGVDSLPSQTGNNGLFLTTDGSTASWAAAGGGAWEYVTSVTATAASTLDVEWTYGEYETVMIVFPKIEKSANGSLEGKMKLNGAYRGGGYRYHLQRSHSSSSSYSGTNGTDDSTIRLLDQSSSESTDPSSLRCIIYNTNQNTQHTQMYWEGTGMFVTPISNTWTLYHHLGHAMQAGDKGISGFRFQPSSGTFTGTAYLYGLKISQGYKMTRYHATPNGNVPFTPEEEAEWDAMEAEYAAGANDRAAAEVRTERDAKLTQSDWTQVADAPVDKAAWATYRQALRDIPSQAGFPNEVTWPVEP